MSAAPTIARIAWRNLWRNRRRTGLALAAIALSMVLVLVYDGILRGYGDWMVDTITGPMLGHVQIHAPDWRRTRAIDRTLRGVGATLASLRRDPAVGGATARIYAPALAARGEEGFGVVVLGIDVQEESRPMRLLAGRPAALGGREVLVGRLLAEQMAARVGDQIAIVGQGADGSLANDLFTVAAILETPVDFVNRQAIVMSLAEAQSLFVMGDEAHEIVVYGHDPRGASRLAADLRPRPELAGAETIDWQSAAPAMVSVIDLVDAAWVVVLGLVLVAAAAGVANTMLMATFERTHEMGMLLALGAGPSRIVGLIVLESIALGVSGALVGTAVGVAVVEWAHRTGVDYAALTGGGPSQLSFLGMNWSLRLYPRLAAIDVIRAVVAVAATSVLAAAWPAARAARLQPARALRD